MQPESRITRRIISRIRERGGWATKIHGGDSFQEDGLPDILGSYRGRSLGLEVKTSVGKLRPRQQYVLDEITKSGGIGRVVRSVKEVDAILDEIDREEVL